MKITITPPCPICGSLRTGYYIVGLDDRKMKEKCFRKGERVRFIPFPKIENCYCVNCGMEWQDKIKKKQFSREQFQSYLFNYDFLKKRKYKTKISEEERDCKKERIINLFRAIIFILTGIDIKKG